MLTITQSQARQFLLSYQVLLPPRSLSGKQGALDYIRHVGCVQFDPLDITGKNAELVLQSRVSDFRPNLLTELLYQDRLLLDGFDKNMAIYPVEDWPYFNRHREAARQNPGRSADALREAFPHILAAIEERGPLSSIELEFKNKVDWWWAPTSLARATLESLYFQGELVIHHKVHTRKVYDLARRHITAELWNTPEPHPDESDFQDWYVYRRIGSFGLLWNRSSEAWLGVPADSIQRAASLKRLLDRGMIVDVIVEGIDVPLYLRRRDLPLLELVFVGEASPPQAAFLAPLDNLLWDRRLLKDLFGFDYRWEVYKPPSDRKYGYYVLPVLFGERFIARFEPVREKKANRLTIKNWWWEKDVIPDHAMLEPLRECFERFFEFLEIRDIAMKGQVLKPVHAMLLVNQLVDLGQNEEA